MGVENSFISVDWGTTNLRIRFVSNPDLHIQGEFFYDNGLKKMNKIWEESKKKFPNRKKYLLDKLIEYLDKTLFEHVNFKNIIISGMASSSIGVQELDYSKIPFNFIKPKINDDIMRGEETQVVGIAEEYINMDKALIIIPGTHSKHIYCDEGIITNFKTFMTGEVFNSFTENTILSSSVSYVEFNDKYKTSFINGVNQIKEGSSLINAAFKIRTNDLFKKMLGKHMQYTCAYF